MYVNICGGGDPPCLKCPKDLVIPKFSGDTEEGVSIPGLGRSPGVEHGNPHQYSCLENPMDRAACQATVHGVAKSWTKSPPSFPWPSLSLFYKSVSLFLFCAVLSHSVMSNSLGSHELDSSLPGSSLHGVSPGSRILECVAMPSFKGSSRPRDPTQVSCIAVGFFTV